MPIKIGEWREWQCPNCRKHYGRPGAAHRCRIPYANGKKIFFWPVVKGWSPPFKAYAPKNRKTYKHVKTNTILG